MRRCTQKCGYIDFTYVKNAKQKCNDFSHSSIIGKIGKAIQVSRVLCKHQTRQVACYNSTYIHIHICTVLLYFKTQSGWDLKKKEKKKEKKGKKRKKKGQDARFSSSLTSQRKREKHIFVELNLHAKRTPHFL
jgi:hypothetical protein